jgi:hypothetical protein
VEAAAYGWAVALACSGEVQLLAPVADSRVPADERLVDSRVLAAASGLEAAPSCLLEVQLLVPVADFPAVAAEFLARADEPAVHSHAPRAAYCWPAVVAVLAD